MEIHPSVRVVTGENDKLYKVMGGGPFCGRHILLSLDNDKCHCGWWPAEQGLSHHILKSALDGSGENSPCSLLSSPFSTDSAQHQVGHEGDTLRNR